MNCPRCGASQFHHVVKLLTGFYDSDNKMYCRRFRCTKCNRIFYTVEFEIECDGELLDAFTYRAPLSEERVAASKKRFDDFRETKKRVRQMQRRDMK